MAWGRKSMRVSLEFLDFDEIKMNSSNIRPSAEWECVTASTLHHHQVSSSVWVWCCEKAFCQLGVKTSRTCTVIRCDSPSSEMLLKLLNHQMHITSNESQYLHSYYTDKWVYIGHVAQYETVLLQTQTISQGVSSGIFIRVIKNANHCESLSSVKVVSRKIHQTTLHSQKQRKRWY